MSHDNPKRIDGTPRDEHPIVLPESVLTQSFEKMETRNKFVHRVYIILLGQLLFTFCFLLVVVFNPTLRWFFQQYHAAIFLSSLSVYVILALCLTFCVNLRRKLPTNYILLALITLAVTFSLSVVSIYYDTTSLIYAMGIWSLVVFSVSLFACQTRWDVTGLGMCLAVATLVFLFAVLIILILAALGFTSKILTVVFSAVGTLLFCVWLTYDTQLVVGGKKIQLSPDEYIFGALTLYLDVVIIFLFLSYAIKFCRKIY